MSLWLKLRSVSWPRYLLMAVWVFGYPFLSLSGLSIWIMNVLHLDFGVAILFGLGFLFLLFLFEILVLQSFVKRNQVRHLLWVFPLGLFMQWMCFTLVFAWVDHQLGGPFLGERSWITAWGMAEIFSQIILAGVYTVLFFFLRNTRARKFIGALALTLFVAGITAEHFYNQAQFQEFQSHAHDFDDFAVKFRNHPQDPTLLEKFPRPARFLFKDGVWTVIDVKDQPISSPLLADFPPDFSQGFYLDRYTDRIFFVKHQMGYVYDLKTHASSTFIGELAQKVMEGGMSISGVHNNYVALSKGAFAGTGDVAVYDLASGKRVVQSQYAGYDDSRTYDVWLNDQGYRLILNAKGDSRQENKMSVYLEEIEGGYQPFSNGTSTVQELSQGIGKYAFGSVEDLKQRKALLVVKAKSSARNNSDRKFSVRNLYQINADELAVEINQGLATVNVKTKEAKFFQKTEEIENLLAHAVLIATDYEDHSVNECAYTQDLHDRLFGSDRQQFVFCLL